MKRFRPTFASVNLSTLAQNAKSIYSALKHPQFFCPMVKANAYGHGDRAVTEKLRSIGVQHIGVGLIEEGVHLRDSGDVGQILHFGLFDRTGIQEMLARDLTPVLSSIDAIKVLIDELSTGHSRPVDVHLKINTGMNRLGIDPGLVRNAARLIEGAKQLNLVGVATHFASGELLSDPHSSSAEQLRVFEASVSEIRKCGLSGFVKHIANSGAAAEMSKTGMTGYGVRPGISLYGIETSTTLLAVQPVLELRSALILIQDVCQGAKVSYGGKWVASRDSRIGVIPCGYADGYSRGLAGSEVLVNGQRVPIVGTICMDYFMCDLTSVPLAKVGDEVILLGESGNHNVTASELAHRLGTIPYEILTGLSERVPRLYNDDGSQSSLI